MTSRSDMPPFPGAMQKIVSKSHPYMLTPEQQAWLAETFPITENRRIMEVMGISYPTLYKFAHQLGLSKSAEGLKAIHIRQCEQHKQINRHHKLLLMGGQKLTRCTNLKVQPYTKRQIDIRRSALDRGYLLAEDISEGSPGRYAIYYDDETSRSARFEETCKRYGLTVSHE
jgi:hypothetical protein